VYSVTSLFNEFSYIKYNHYYRPDVFNVAYRNAYNISTRNTKKLTYRVAQKVSVAEVFEC